MLPQQSKLRISANQLIPDIQLYNSHYPPVELEIFSDVHDRFLIIDSTELYHIYITKDFVKNGLPFR